jgi:hypothetical protein
MKAHPSWLTWLFSFYSLCFLGASINHVRDIVLGGFLPYRHVPWFFNAVWTSLAFVDVVVPLLFMLGKPKHAMLLAAAIMVFDVVLNALFAMSYRDSIFGDNMDLQAQTAFLVLLLLTVPIAWRALPSHQRDITMA